MLNVRRRYAVAAALAVSAALAAPAAAQQRPAEQRPAEERPSEIVVTGARDRARQVSDFVNALTETRVRGQLGRFEQAVCPSAIGLADAQNRKVADRIRAVAAAAGVPVGAADCSPNVFVVVAQDRDEMVRTIRASWRDPRRDRVAAPDQSGPAAVLHLEGLLDANGVPVGVRDEDGDGRSGYYVVEMGDGSSRIRPASRPHFLASAMVVESQAVEGLTTTQLADYAAMRLLARIDPSRLEGSTAPTILTVLDAPMGSEVPITLTQWDLGFLRAFYASGENRYANHQRSEMRRRLTNELERAYQEANE